MAVALKAAAVRGRTALTDLRTRAARVAAFRAVLLAMAGLLIGVSGSFPRLLPAFVAMIALELIVSLPVRFFRTPAAAVAEGMAIVAVATVPEPASGNLMLCLLAPALAAGLGAGYRWVAAVVLTAVAVGVLLILRMPTGFDTQSLIDLFQWSVLALALGTTAAWYVAQQRNEDPVARSYAEALRTLTELSAISRRLPGGLDVRTLAGRSLADAVSAVSADRGVVVTYGYRGSLDTAAVVPDEASEWLARVGSLEDWADLAQGRGTVTRRTSDGVLLMQPLSIGDAGVAFFLLRSSHQPSERQLSSLESIAAEAAVPLQAALMFADVRDFATSEERSRLAREIHDGIAQDVAFLGYAADELASVAGDPATAKLATELRHQISRVVSDLRTSVFKLREGVSPAESLGATIGTHTRRIFGDSPTAVHLTINESPNRLRPDIESELLRIVQESLTNVRRHAGAANVWVTCDVDAPAATLVVEDDGSGMGPLREDSYGLQIMRERAARISADVTIAERPGGGTRVEIAV